MGRAVASPHLPLEFGPHAMSNGKTERELSQLAARPTKPTAADWDNPQSVSAERGLSQTAAITNAHDHSQFPIRSSVHVLPIRTIYAPLQPLRVGTIRSTFRRSAVCPKPQLPRTPR